MKKTLLLSVVASTMIMAGGDITPVEPVVETPIVAEASGWDFGGQGVVYYQTAEFGTGSLFKQAEADAAIGLQLSAVNKNLFAGIGAGFELTGLSLLGLQNNVVSGMVQNASLPGGYTGAAVTQVYLTYGIGNTSLKVGRQTLSKSLSPFAFSESWNVFKNTFEAALVVNSDLPDTTLVYALVGKSNPSSSNLLAEKLVNPSNGNLLVGKSNLSNGNLNTFEKINDKGNVVHMITAQNKSINGLTLTGTWYYAPDMFVTDDTNVLWGDAKLAISDYTVALQGGTVRGAIKDTAGFGAKIGGNFGMFDASVAYSTVDAGSVPIHNLGTSVKTPLYTQMILNQNHIKSDNNTVVLRAGVKALGGKFGVAYDLTTDNANSNSDYTELDLSYKTKITDNTTLFAAYVRAEDDGFANPLNLIRVWGRYNF